MKTKITAFVLIIILLSSLPLIGGCFAKPSPELTARQFLSYFTTQDYSAMYYMISPSSAKKIGKDEFTVKYRKIYEALGLEDIKISPHAMQEGADLCRLPFTAELTTQKAGKLNLDFTMQVSCKQKQWTVDWTPALILPGMDWGDKAAARTLYPSRGEIFDTEGNLFAQNKPGSTVYVDMAKLSDKQVMAQSLAPLVQMQAEDIITILNKAQEREDTYAVVKRYTPDTLSQELAEQLVQVTGVGIDYKKMSMFRYYPYKQGAAHAAGYMGVISPDELKLPKYKGFPSDLMVGRSGVEKLYEDVLRGELGWEMYITDANGRRKSDIYVKPAVNGQDLVLTMDGLLEDKAYKAMSQLFGDTISGSVVVIDPSCGGVKALTSFPSFDPNLFNLPIPKDVWDDMFESEASRQPLFNRATQAQLPAGSAFKPFTALIGLDTGAITKDFVFNQTITNDTWKPNNMSWSYPPIRRTPGGSGPLNLNRALVHSDNIYFAYTALTIGAPAFNSGVKTFGIGETVPFELGAKPSQLSNGGDITDIKLLADTGYGQGEMLTPPVQLAAMYQLFANGSTMYAPYMVQSINDTVDGAHVPVNITAPTVWKSGLSTEQSIQTVQDILKRVVTEGTAYSTRVQGMTLAGKTGTAQMGTDAREIGWFVGYVVSGGKQYVVCVTADGPKDKTGVKLELARQVFMALKESE